MDRCKIELLFSKIKGIIDAEINLIDLSGYVIESTCDKKMDTYDSQFKGLHIEKGILKKGNYLYFFYMDRYIISIRETDDQAEKLAKILGLFMTEDSHNPYEEEVIKDILLRRAVKSDLRDDHKIINRDSQDPMQVSVIKIKKDMGHEVKSLITHIYPKDYFIKINRDLFVFIKHDKDGWEEYVPNIYESMYSELFYEAQIGVGTIVYHIQDLPTSYEKAMVAMKLGSIFLNNKDISYYKDLGIPVLIENMNMEKLKEFKKDMHYEIGEVLKDKELEMTILQFFKNDLNVSETAKKIFIHRNTLIYRLNKIYKLTGYDLRKFEDAMNFKIAMLIHVYLQEDQLGTYD
ncbi:MAG: helix-turn-helix domain-containing protein [Anaeromicrobium sp.]|jgi:carbohydrate diacid regulator|uniref:PucR family transcriptional regulator n=1 Tax=Anaeromicrobium sp. TaxID=1929132 RepID=UPI0025D44612|nr:PucR family transcriptional regulator [Anaeromicrobium sp.]MCT4593849.1 helix-turn-helix domain-containing protein [Anaeromicrobium sp.]